MTFFILYAFTSQAQETGKWGDQGNGLFRNPIIAGDYSDPDPIRVGTDYYMAASTFESYPGLTILHSKDLVNWEYSGSVFNNLADINKDFRWDKMNKYGDGIFAPSLRYHNGKFWVFVNFFGDGFFMATADHPSKDWEIHQIKDKNGKPLRTTNWTDPCPFWDDNGKAYLASSRVGEQWFGYLFEMTPDGKQLLDADVAHMNLEDIKYNYPKGGTLFSPFQSTEGNKIYKRNGFYYLVHIEFLPDGQGCGTYFMRSKHIYGTKDDGTPGRPGDIGKYEIYKIGNDDCEGVNQEFPGQGGLVDTPDGRWFWIGQFNRINTDKYRVPHLVPVTWIHDWPVFGSNVKNGKGHMLWEMEKPIKGFPIVYPYINDDFNEPTLNPIWQWNHVPNNKKWSLTEKEGYLRLHASKASTFYKAPNTLLQRHFKSDSTFTTIKIQFDGIVNGQKAGLAHFTGGENYAHLGVEKKGDNRFLFYEHDEQITEIKALKAHQNTLYLKTKLGMDNITHWFYSFDGSNYIKIKNTYSIEAKGFRGDMVGVYSYNTKSDSGYIDLDWFIYEVNNKP
ncbi:glycoside hydrolase 43 family protein [Seonamhaeicola sp.]|uniref:glycoside hydrolase family 43 protein n=1 Tax=Seonamhaeicola sp. TaxID=1912245 RepID=UPI00260300B6|nr:glycoside hydrolase 43 family protein [Seonamhaeicola sp.]